MFSFKEDLKAQRGPFEDEKNIKGWGGHNANTKNIYIYIISKLGQI